MFSNFLWSILGALLMLLLGAILGFWIEELTYSQLTKGFYECKC